MLLTTQAVVTILGLCIAYWLDYATSFAANSPMQWRLPCGFQGFFAICLVIQASMLPETPRWLVQEGRSEEAAVVLANLEGKDITPDHPDVVRLRTEIETSVEMGKIQNFRRICLSIAVELMQQFTGSNMIVSSFTHCIEQNLTKINNKELLRSGSLPNNYEPLP
jgi:hypothetical protein